MIVAHYLVDNLHTHNIWTIKMFIAEIMYFLNVLGNIYFIDVFLGMGRNEICSLLSHFLGGEFRTYGLQVASITEEDPADRVDPMSRIFPRMTKCTFNKFGPSGTLQRRDAMCVLPVNIINEVRHLNSKILLHLLSTLENLCLPLVLADCSCYHYR